MARKPNYRFERFERERTRAAKKAQKAKAKAEKAGGKEAGPDEDRTDAPSPNEGDDASRE